MVLFRWRITFIIINTMLRNHKTDHQERKSFQLAKIMNCWNQRGLVSGLQNGSMARLRRANQPRKMVFFFAEFLITGHQTRFSGPLTSRIQRRQNKTKKEIQPGATNLLRKRYNMQERRINRS
uniref:Uncharacterized protein n=1 Tax=Arundo donax TaxID=35708 RepID=A0A0A9FCJ5_ARUDO